MYARSPAFVCMHLRKCMRAQKWLRAFKCVFSPLCQASESDSACMHVFVHRHTACVQRHMYVGLHRRCVPTHLCVDARVCVLLQFRAHVGSCVELPVLQTHVCVCAPLVQTPVCAFARNFARPHMVLLRTFVSALGAHMCVCFQTRVLARDTWVLDGVRISVFLSLRVRASARASPRMCAPWRAQVCAI